MVKFFVAADGYILSRLLVVMMGSVCVCGGGGGG